MVRLLRKLFPVEFAAYCPTAIQLLPPWRAHSLFEQNLQFHVFAKWLPGDLVNSAF